jgi:hypothetical protein
VDDFASKSIHFQIPIYIWRRYNMLDQYGLLTKLFIIPLEQLLHIHATNLSPTLAIFQT